MKRMELNHWYINNNDLSIALMKYHVSIKKIYDKDIYEATFKNSYEQTIVLEFTTLEEAVTFVETKSCIDSLEEMINNKQKNKSLTKRLK